MASLILYSAYDRRAVHDLLEPESPFVTQAGKWGLRGIIRLNNPAGDFALFVTFGKQEGSHAFDESISDAGILRWQSQPKQTFTSRAVVDLIAHDERRNTVHLFLRTAERRKGHLLPYTYLGALKYLQHDAQRERPVHIAWELLNWPIPADVSAGMQLTIVSEGKLAAIDTAVTEENHGAPATGTLIEEGPPVGVQRRGTSTRKFKAMKRRYVSSEESRDLGLRGELLVLRRERMKLAEAGREDLVALIRHTSLLDGDGTGYDILSFFPDGREKYIEVKTTTGPKPTEFFVSQNEVAFSEFRCEQFELCRIFDYDPSRNSGFCYTLSGAIKDNCELTEAHYRAKVL